MKKKYYISPELQMVSLCLPKSICQGIPQGGDPNIINPSSDSGQEESSAPARGKLYV